MNMQGCVNEKLLFKSLGNSTDLHIVLKKRFKINNVLLNFLTTKVS